jgi:CheY-like chemotaxis protein
MKRVLVVDDEPVIRALVVASLAADFKVSAAADGRDALAALQSERPDVVLLDVSLPGMSGAEVLRQIRADVGLCGVPVLLLTGLEPPADLEPDGVVLKPFTPTTLRASLTPWLN